MEDNAEFELSFNFKNVLYVAQVTILQGEQGVYYSLVYYTPNEKGEIPVLVKRDEEGIVTWEEPGHAHEPDLIHEIGTQIEIKISG